MKAWIARDKDNTVHLYFKKPIKLEEQEEWHSLFDAIRISENEMPEGCNPQWTDSEPTEIKIKLFNNE